MHKSFIIAERQKTVILSLILQDSEAEDMLTTKYGLDVNSKTYRVIGSNVGLLQADGMDEESIPQIYKDYTTT